MLPVHPCLSPGRVATAAPGGGRSTLRSTSSFGPKACTCPSASVSTRSTAGERARPMGDDDDDRAAPRAPRGSPGQRLFALGVEVGVRLVEHDQERLAVERAGQRHPLPLPADSTAPASPIRVS